MTQVLRAATRAALVLLGFTVVGTAILAYTYTVTRPAIQHNEDAARLKLIAETLIPGSYDNNPLTDALTLPPHKLLGTDATSQVWRARKGGQPAALVLEATAPDGYSGKINLLVGIGADGRITGVRVVSHKETPGLGDYIDIAKSKWIEIFNGKSVTQPAASGWQVKKDGGQFDYMAGATITPRAVVKAVHHALEYAAAHHTQLFAATPGAQP